MLKLFSGTSNPELTNQVAHLLNIPLSKSEVVRFQNSEVRVRVEEDVKNEFCVVIQSTDNPTDTNLMEMFLFCDALKRQEARKVIGIIPYFGYARQDIQHREGECVSANVVIRFLESIGFDKIYTFDIHDEATQGVFSIPFKNLSASSLVADEIKKYIGETIDRKKVTIVSPDQGGIERARKFGEHLFGDDKFSVAVIEKKRDQDHIHKSEVLDIYGDVKNKTVILLDDIVTSGSTLIPAVKICREKGAEKVFAAIMHHDFSPAASEKIQALDLEKFFTTNTIRLKDQKGFAKLHEISIAPIIAEELRLFKTR